MPALIFLLALAVLAVVVWVRVADRDSAADVAGGCGSAPQLPANAAVTVTVLNGVGTDGLAGQALDAFGKAGFGKGNVGDADPLAGIATVTSGPNGTAGALLVHYYLTGSTVTVDTREDTSVTVTIGARYRGLATAAQAKQAMIAAQVSQSPAAPGATATGAPASGASGPTSPSPTATCFTTPPYPTPTTSASPAAS
ncbi:LytR C-terminal domain-containing protein [Jatrophihabitans sp. YIM 134969]